MIEGKLPTYAYANHAQNITSYFKSIRYNDENVTSVHYWIDTIDAPLHVRNSIKALRDAPVIIDKIQESYPGYRIVPEKNSDEVYLSVDPLKRRNSDVVLSDCHYDAPFKYVPQCGNVFIRIILALNENTTTYTTIESNKSVLSTLDFNGVDYNNDYHCVKGYIPPGEIRILLKLHFLCIHPTSPQSCIKFTHDLNNSWTHFSRELMRKSADPTTSLEHVISFVVLGCSKLYNNSNILYVGIGLMVALSIIFIVRCLHSTTWRLARGRQGTLRPPLRPAAASATTRGSGPAWPRRPP